MKLSNETYDLLKKVALTWMPALSVLVLAIFGIWGIPYGEQISGTIMAIDTFLGALLGLSAKKYNEGE